MKAPIRNIPPELNRRLDDLEKVSVDIDINAIVETVLDQIVIPKAKFPDGLNQQFLIYNAEGEGWVASYIDNLAVRGVLYVNSDYATGDEDAIIDFNNGTARITWEYEGGEGISQFLMGDKLRCAETYSTDVFGTDNHAFVGRFGCTYDYASWTLEGLYAGINLLVQTENKLNEADTGKIELAGLGSHMWSLWANSKAAAYAGDFSVSRGNACETENWTIGVNVGVFSDLDPSEAIMGVGVRAYSQDMAPITGVRQHTAFLAEGARGWKYGFLYMDTDAATTLCSIDQSGNLMVLSNLAACDSIFVNYDYASGDEDATIYFNSTNHTFKFDYGNSRFQISSHLFTVGGFQAAENIYVNVDYVSGDEDAFVYFNATDHYLKFDYGNDQFETDKDIVANSVSLADHNARHESGGGDEMDIGPLGSVYVCHANAVVCHNNSVVYN